MRGGTDHKDLGIARTRRGETVLEEAERHLAWVKGVIERGEAVPEWEGNMPWEKVREMLEAEIEMEKRHPSHWYHVTIGVLPVGATHP